MRARRARRAKEEEKQILIERGVEEDEHEDESGLEEGHRRARSESMGSSVRTITNTTSTTRWSSVVPDGESVYVLPSILEMGRIEEEWE
jgi:hypothetical protein